MLRSAMVAVLLVAGTGCTLLLSGDDNNDVDAGDTEPSGECPSGWVQFAENDHCYRASEPGSLFLWNDAQSRCITEGGALATASSLEEWNFMTGVPDASEAWIGARYVNTGGGEKVEWLGEPTNDFEPDIDPRFPPMPNQCLFVSDQLLMGGVGCAGETTYLCELVPVD